MSQTPIELKGSNFTLSVVHLRHTRPEIIHQALQDKIVQAPAFLKNAPVVLNVATLSGDIDWHKMQQAITSTGLHIVGVSGCKDETLKQVIIQAGLPVLSEGKDPQKNAAEPSDQSPQWAEKTPSKTRLINTPVRSGQQIYARGTDLIITNSVSAGAELVADGNIHVYGTMRGRALAGASGDSHCQIFCTNLSAELVSIAGEYWLMDQIPPEFFGKASRLSLKEGALTIQTLD